MSNDLTLPAKARLLYAPDDIRYISVQTDVTGNITGEIDEELVGDIVRPNNTVVLVGERVVVPCTANADNESRWDYRNYRWNAMASVYNGKKVHDVFTRRFNLNLDTCKFRVCDLTIRSVQLEDAGFFVCFQPSITKRVAAAVVVFGTNRLL